MDKIFSAQFCLHKGKSGAAQFSQILPTWKMSPGKDPDSTYHKCVREGAIFLEVAKLLGKDSNGNDTFDWSNKISFAIGVPDVCKILDGFLQNTKIDLFHDAGDASKKLVFTPGEGNYAGTWRMMLSINNKNDASANQSITVPMSPGEAAFFYQLVSSSCRKLLGWDYGT